MRSSAHFRMQFESLWREMRKNPIFIPKQIDFMNSTDVRTAVSAVCECIFVVVHNRQEICE